MPSGAAVSFSKLKFWAGMLAAASTHHSSEGWQYEQLHVKLGNGSTGTHTETMLSHDLVQSPRQEA